MTSHQPSTLIALALALLAAVTAPAIAQFNCIPNCDPTDSRSLVIASGGDLVTLSDPLIDLQIQVPAGAGSFELGIFDGDANDLAPTGFGFDDSFWDTGTENGVDFAYTLYADPEADGVPPAGDPGNEIDINGPDSGNSFLSDDMLNNDWCCANGVAGSPGNFVVPVGPEAVTPSGNYFYTLRIELTDATFVGPTPNSDATISHSFKVRTSALASIEPFAQPFSYIARWGSFFGDALIAYPDSSAADDLSDWEFRDTPTTYDGDFSFFFTVAAERQELDLWDGDFDHGRFDCPFGGPIPAAEDCDDDENSRDTDDLDTPNTDNDFPSNRFPPWNTEDGVGEGVAEGRPGTRTEFLTGSPPDDTNPIVNITGAGTCSEDPSELCFSDSECSGTCEPRDTGRFVQRPPSVAYDLIAPDGREFINLNPSGNREWEQFIVSSHPDCDATSSCVPNDDPGDRPGFPCSDVCTDRPLPPGTYELRIRGVDMQNLNAVRLPEKVVCVGESGGACGTLSPYTLCDTVFRDQRGGAGTIAGDGTQQPGEPGINGVLVNLYNGERAYAGTTITANDGAEDGRYAFGVGAGEYTVEVAGENFAAPTAGPVGAVGDRVWYDADGGGNDVDAGEPGIANVRLRLWDDGGDGPGGGNDAIIASTYTDRDGEYLFTGLADGTYFVTVDESSVPDGLSFAGGTGTSAGSPAVATISGGNQVLTLDFGYGIADGDTAWVGDFVWSDSGVDTDGDGIPDSGIADGVQDIGEIGIEGVRIELWLCANLDCDDPTFVTSTTTAADGSYHFVVVPPADGTFYEVRVTDDAEVLSGYTQTGDPGGACTACDGAYVVTLSPGDLVPTVDFGYKNSALADLSDKVWLDVDSRNGELDAGQESGIEGVTVSLLRGMTVVATTVTGPDGDFTFADLPPGDYRVVITDLDLELNGLAPTTPAALDGGLGVTIVGTTSVSNVSFGYADSGALEGMEGTTAWDQEPDDPNDQTRDVPLIVGGEEQNNLDYDFGYIGAGSIGDRVWRDDNGDGVQDSGEPGLDGVTVRLYDGDGLLVDVQVTATVDGVSGYYLFEDLPPDDYTVVVDAGTLPAGLQPTYDWDDGTGPILTPGSASLTLPPGAEEDRVDFGYDECGPCMGKVSELALRYLGDEPAVIRVVAKKGGKIGELVFPPTLVQPGDTFGFVGGPSGSGGHQNTLGTEIRIYADGALRAVIHTSCSQPIGPGTQVGDYVVVWGKSLVGGLLCPEDGGEPPADCGPCDGKVTSLTLLYSPGPTLGGRSKALGPQGAVEDGGAGVTVTVVQQSGMDVYPDVLPGETIVVLGRDGNSTLGPNVEIYVDGTLNGEIHTSCSQPIGTGMRSGDFVIVEGASRFGGPLCPYDETEW